jgi:hypothetical protein
MHFMYKVWYVFFLVFSWNVTKLHVSAVKTQWKHMKTLEKQCISCVKYDTCVFLYKCEMYQNYMFPQWKHNENTVKTHENTWKTVHFMYKLWYMYFLVYRWNVPKIHLSKVKHSENTMKTQWKHMETLKKQWILCIKYDTCVFL